MNDRPNKVRERVFLIRQMGISGTIYIEADPRQEVDGSAVEQFQQHCRRISTNNRGQNL